MNEIKINVPEGMEIDKENSTFECIKFKPKRIPKKELPKTWEEFCMKYPIKKEETYVSSGSNIISAKLVKIYEKRECEVDKNLLPSEEYAEAMLALCQLIQLRDCYNNGWKANWRDTNQHKYVVKFYDERLINDINFNKRCVLNFKTPKLREEFINNFKNLIEKAKPLL